MSNFNFNIKRQSYNCAVSNIKEALLKDDLIEAKNNINLAINLCKQLIDNSIIPEIRNKYIQELSKLNSLFTSVSNGNNPFINKQVEVRTNVSSNTNNVESNKVEKSENKEKKYKFFSQESPSLRLKDVAGLSDVKKEILLKVIAPMKEPELYKSYMDTSGCNILMYGPPGCGKSFIAEAIAGELSCAYAIVNTYDLLDKYVGEGPKKVAELFSEADEFDNCLIFLDELDSLFASRESEDSTHTKDILTSLLTCMSGFKGDKKGNTKVLIGATNRPWALDSALLRGKRFDTQIYVGLPDKEAREFLINKAFKNNRRLIEESDINVEYISNLFDGYSSADITSMLEKIKALAFERALYNKQNNIDKFEPISKNDVDQIKANYRNSISEMDLMNFENFKKGVI